MPLKHCVALFSFILLLCCSASSALATQSWSEGEQDRVREHLSRVEVRLRQRDVSQLSAAQRRARAANLDRLRAYHEAGVFPQNIHHPAGFVPVFVDHDDRLCAMAALLVADGQLDLVAEVEARENFARIKEMRTPGLGSWLEENGLTLEEAAQIQPGYDYKRWCKEDCGCEVEPSCYEHPSEGLKTARNECVAQCEVSHVDGVDEGAFVAGVCPGGAPLLGPARCPKAHLSGYPVAPIDEPSCAVASRPVLGHRQGRRTVVLLLLGLMLLRVRGRRARD